MTGRIGYTWEAVPGLTFFSQYATGADVSANNIFLLSPTQPLDLTTARTYETGVKHLFWDNRAEWSFSAYDILRKNVYAAAGGQALNIAGRQESRGVELAASVRPIEPVRLWGNIAYVDARYTDYNFVGGSFSGNTPPNVPRIVANAGASYRFFTPWLVELGITGRHVGDRYNTDANTVTMKAYTVADVYAFVDIPNDGVWRGRPGPPDFPRPQHHRQALRDLGRSVLSRPDPAGRAAHLRALGRVQMVGR
ncbi:TonB-dependent receptor domain-containing protein [Bradyrhizobium betae]